MASQLFLIADMMSNLLFRQIFTYFEAPHTAFQGTLDTLDMPQRTYFTNASKQN